MTLGITDLATFVLGTIFIVLLPGPNSLYVLSVAARRGIGAGYLGACGIFVGDLILMVLSATGAASLLRATPWLFLLIKSAGAIYLAWVGVSLLRAAWTMWRRRHEAASDALPQRDQRRPFRTPMVIQPSNPKGFLFCISFFIQFVDPGHPSPELSFALLGLIVQICSAAYLSLLIFAGARLAAGFRRHRRSSALATGSVGCLFLGFGGKLAGASLG